MKRYKSFYMENPDKWIFELNDGSFEEYAEFPIPCVAVGLSTTIELLIVESRWDFEEHPLCPIALGILEWTFLRDDLTVISEKYVDCIGEVDITDGCSCWRPPYKIDVLWCWDEGQCKVNYKGVDHFVNEKTLCEKYLSDRELPNIQNIYDVIDYSQIHLPKEYRYKAWTYEGLEHGCALLKTYNQLNAYTVAYAEMHYLKCKAAFQNFPYKKLVDGSIEIVDWGCGQGFGSITAIEELINHDKFQWLRKVNLIEPSISALKRAEHYVSNMTSGNAIVRTYAKYLPNKGYYNEISSMHYSGKNVIHIFSNILDVPTIDLEKLASICISSENRHFIVCMGPLNTNSYRLDDFSRIFGQQEFFSAIDDKYYTRTHDTFHYVSCKTRCFQYNGAPLLTNNIQFHPDMDGCDIIYDDYDIKSIVSEGHISESLANLYQIISGIINPSEDIVILKPVFEGQNPDLLVVRPNRGILVVKMFEEDLNNFEFKKFSKQMDHLQSLDSDSKEAEFVNYKILVKKNSSNNEIESPISVLSRYQKQLLKQTSIELLYKIADNSHNYSIVQKLLICTKNDSKETQHYFKDYTDFSIVYGSDFFVNDKWQKNLFRTACIENARPEFTPDTMSRLMRLLSPVWHLNKEGKIGFNNLTSVQKGLAESYANKMQKISGVAGSGKTMVMAMRAVRAQLRTGGNILVLAYNKTLVNYLYQRICDIREDFPLDKIHISHYHRFFKQHAVTHLLRVHKDSYDYESYFQSTHNLIKYDAIFIDEVQDYKTVWLKILQNYFLKENGEFVVFGDPKQNVYKRELDTNGDIKLGIIGGQWNHDLKDSIRFHSPNLERLSVAFQKKFFPPETTKDLKVPNEMDLISCIKYKNIGHIGNIQILLDSITALISNEKIPDCDTTIIAQGNDIMRELADGYTERTDKTVTTTFCTAKEIQRLQSEKRKHPNSNIVDDIDSLDAMKRMQFYAGLGKMQISTIDSFKGWESPIVIFVLQDEDSGGRVNNYGCMLNGSISPEVVYTAITRAQESLYVINLGNKKYDEFFSKYPSF